MGRRGHSLDCLLLQRWIIRVPADDGGPWARWSMADCAPAGLRDHLRRLHRRRRRRVARRPRANRARYCLKRPLADRRCRRPLDPRPRAEQPVPLGGRLCAALRMRDGAASPRSRRDVRRRRRLLLDVQRRPRRCVEIQRDLLEFAASCAVNECRAAGGGDPRRRSRLRVGTRPSADHAQATHFAPLAEARAAHAVMGGCAYSATGRSCSRSARRATEFTPRRPSASASRTPPSGRPPRTGDRRP